MIIRQIVQIEILFIDTIFSLSSQGYQKKACIIANKKNLQVLAINFIIVQFFF